jgi:hypothetical protein
MRVKYGYLKITKFSGDKIRDQNQGNTLDISNKGNNITWNSSWASYQFKIHGQSKFVRKQQKWQKIQI